LTHRSISGEHMERIEFLGDAVLGLIIAASLYEQFPNAAEGELTRMRATLVCKNGLLTIAQRWGLASYLHVGVGERDKGGNIKSASITANAVESVIGAVFLDGGWSSVRSLVLNAWVDLMHDRGVDCSPRFEADCFINGNKAGSGTGARKKTAEMKAAAEACRHLQGMESS